MCVLKLETPGLKGPFGQPPFDEPSIQKAITNMLVYKYSHVGQQELKTLYELAQILFQCLNTMSLPPPSNQKHLINKEEAIKYKIEYTR